MGNAHPKRKRNLVIKSMLWSHWRDMLPHLTSRLLPQMTEMGCVTDLVDGQSGLVILGDKGDTGEVLTENLSRQGIRLMALKRSNSKTDWPRHERQLIFRLRRRVETVFSQLSGQINAERVHARSFQGMCMRLVNKILAYNLCMVLNRTFGEDCELALIKKFVF